MRLSKYIKNRISQCWKAILNRLSTSYKLNYIQGHGVSRVALQGLDTKVMEGSTIDKKSVIGSYSYIGKNVSITRTEIGNYCSIANNVSIGQGEHLTDNISTNSMFYDNAFEILTDKKCVIGHDVWIGVDAIILRGVTVGDGAIIGANSVVTKDVPAFSIVVGSPAKIVKCRFDTETQYQISESKWWDKTPAEAKKIFDELEK